MECEKNQAYFYASTRSHRTKASTLISYLECPGSMMNLNAIELRETNSIINSLSPNTKSTNPLIAKLETNIDRLPDEKEQPTFLILLTPILPLVLGSGKN